MGAPLGFGGMEFLLLVALPVAIVAALALSVRRYRRRLKDSGAEVRIPPIAMGDRDGPFTSPRI